MDRQEYLNDKFIDFKNDFKNNYRMGYHYSGLQIADLISDSETVIDIGCGTNPFKGKIKNLVGIDPCDMGADVVTTLEDYKTDVTFDVALCLGSINFGTQEIIERQMYLINKLLNKKARIYWRLKRSDINPLPEHNYAWTLEKLNQFAEQYGFKQKNCREDDVMSKPQMERWYCEWHRN